MKSCVKRNSIIISICLVWISTGFIYAVGIIPGMDELSKGNNEFCFNLYDQLINEKKGNIFFSPYSISTALAMTYVSYFEGFGIPITEAFYCGTPVITSNVTSMPEVAGDAALIVDPFSPESIADAMVKMASDEDLRKTLIMKANERKKIFTWQKSEDRLWEAILKTVKT